MMVLCVTKHTMGNAMALNNVYATVAIAGKVSKDPMTGKLSQVCEKFVYNCLNYITQEVIIYISFLKTCNTSQTKLNTIWWMSNA